MMKWEYVKGSEADFAGAPNWCTHVSLVDSVVAWEESSRAIPGNRYQWKGEGYIENYGENAGGELPVIAERRRVDSLQGRVNDANLQQIMSNAERIRRETWCAVSGEAFDTVQRPAHYNQSDIQCIDAIAAAVKGKSGMEAVCVGHVIRYLWRYEIKDGLESIKKAQWYLNRLISELEEQAR